MTEIIIDKALKDAAPSLALGVLLADVSVSKDNERLSTHINEAVSALSRSLSLEELSGLTEIAALREAYRVLGKDPSRYRGSQDALLRRIIQGKGIYRINTVVDTNNLLSIQTKQSVGTYDIARLSPPVSFRVGRQGESYKGIGKATINIEGLPVLADAAGPFGSPTSDSERAMITTETRHIMMVIIAFSGTENLERDLRNASELVNEIGVVNSTLVYT